MYIALDKCHYLLNSYIAVVWIAVTMNTMHCHFSTPPFIHEFSVLTMSNWHGAVCNAFCICFAHYLFFGNTLHCSLILDDFCRLLLNNFKPNTNSNKGKSSCLFKNIFNDKVRQITGKMSVKKKVHQLFRCVYVTLFQLFLWLCFCQPFSTGSH